MKIEYFESEYPIYWQWPIYTGYLPDADIADLLVDINKKSWFTKFNYLLQLEKGRTQCNILLLKGTLKNVIRQVIDFQYSIRTDIIIVFSKNNETFSKTGLDILVNYARCNGIAIISKLDYLEEWLVNLSVHLSHNENIVEAIKFAGSVEYLYVTSELSKKTTVKGFTEGLLTRLQSSDCEAIPNETIDDLSRNLSDFTFESESSDASTINDVITEIEKNIPSSTIRGGNWDVPPKDLPLEKSIVPESTKSSSIEPRFLQCKIYQEDLKNQPITDYLKYEESYEILVRIGPSSDDWLQGIRSKPVKGIYEMGQEQDILIEIRSTLNDNLEQKNISLPQYGVSSSCVFNISTGKKNTISELKAEISAYHKNRLIQQVVLTAYILNEPPLNVRVPPIYMEASNLKVSLNDLDQRSEFGNSYRLEEGVINHPKGISKKMADLEKSLNIIRDTIEQIARKSKEEYRDLFHPDNQQVLKKLALHGSLLYQKEFMELDELGRAVQVVSRIKKYIPLEFIYTFPTPSKNATLCQNAKEALQEGKCKGCMDLDTTDAAPHVCPLGFICLNRVIERHDIKQQSDWTEEGDFALYSEPTKDRNKIPILTSTLLGASSQVDNHTPNTINAITKHVSDFTASFNQVNSWEEWLQKIETHQPSSLILVTHTEEHEVFEMPQLEIGEKDFLMQVLIKKKHIVSDKAKFPPLVFLIGCRTQDNDSEIFDFTRHFKENGAAIVLSNFTIISGRQAKRIIIKLYDFFKKNKGKKIRLGQIMLELRQYLISEGLMVSFALVAHGDADWLIEL